MSRVEFRVYGTAVQQGSKKAFVVKGRARIVDDNSEELKAWRLHVAQTLELALLNTERPVFAKQTPVRVAIAFYMPRGSTVRRPWPAVSPDLDKLVRAIGDSLTDARVYADDGQTVAFDVIETYDDDVVPHAHVVVSAIHPNALAQWRARNER